MIGQAGVGAGCGVTGVTLLLAPDDRSEPFAVTVAEAARVAAAVDVEEGSRILVAAALAEGPWTCGTVVSCTGSGPPRARANVGPAAECWRRLERQAQAGPGHDVLDADILIVTDLAAETRWPHWSSVAVELGVRAAVAVRLHAGGRTLGALTLYAPAPLESADETLLRVPRAVGGQLSALLWADDQREHLRRGLGARSRVGQAMGVIMQRDGLTAEQAFGRLRRHSQQRNVKISLIVAELLDEPAHDRGG